MFDLSSENKVLILLLLVAVAVYLLSGSQKTEPIHNEGVLSYDPKLSDNFNDVIDTDMSDNSSNDTKSTGMSNGSIGTNGSGSTVSSESVSNYKSSSYDKGDRRAKSDEIDKFFEGSYPK